MVAPRRLPQTHLFIMTDSLYLSRSFVDFGPFKPAEIEDFIKRGIVVPSDYVRQELTTDWMSISDWQISLTAPAPAKTKAKKAAAKKKSAA